MIASQVVEWVSSHAVHDTATTCTKKLNQEVMRPMLKMRKFAVRERVADAARPTSIVSHADCPRAKRRPSSTVASSAQPSANGSR